MKCVCKFFNWFKNEYWYWLEFQLDKIGNEQDFCSLTVPSKKYCVNLYGQLINL